LLFLLQLRDDIPKFYCLICCMEMIDSCDKLHNAAIHYGMLPFFANNIPGFSVEEMAAPGLLFGETLADEGCWEWKGPVIRRQTTAYGKFFRRKAGFVSLELLPDFLNYRRSLYRPTAGSVEDSLLKLVCQNEGLTSAQMRQMLLPPSPRRKAVTTIDDAMAPSRPRRQALEGPLQRLQMGGWLLIADFEYKFTSTGQRYGWGVALYSTPEIWFENTIKPSRRSPQQSFERLCQHLAQHWPTATSTQIKTLLK
jgi:hypothetical protein